MIFTHAGLIRREIPTIAHPDDVWDALRDIGASHTRLEPGARAVTFGNGMVVRELIVSIDDAERRIVWSATGGSLTHHNASARVVSNRAGTRVIWPADPLRDEAAGHVAATMREGMAVMRQTLDRPGIAVPSLPC